MRVAAGAPMLFNFNGECLADMGVAPPPAQDWLRGTVAAQKVLLPAVFTSDIIVPPAPVPVAELGLAAAAAPRVIPTMVVTDGSHSTGGAGSAAGAASLAAWPAAFTAACMR